MGIPVHIPYMHSNLWSIKCNTNWLSHAQRTGSYLRIVDKMIFCYNRTLLLVFPKRLPKFQCSLKSYFFSNSNISNDYAKKLFQNLTHFIFIFFGMHFIDNFIFVNFEFLSIILFLDSENSRIWFYLPWEWFVSTELVFSTCWKAPWNHTFRSVVQRIFYMKQKHHSLHVMHCIMTM